VVNKNSEVYIYSFNMYFFYVNFTLSFYTFALGFLVLLLIRSFKFSCMFLMTPDLIICIPEVVEELSASIF
jgi:hypothetical protein